MIMMNRWTVISSNNQNWIQSIRWLIHFILITISVCLWIYNLNWKPHPFLPMGFVDWLILTCFVVRCRGDIDIACNLTITLRNDLMNVTVSREDVPRQSKLKWFHTDLVFLSLDFGHLEAGSFVAHCVDLCYPISFYSFTDWHVAKILNELK